MSVSNQMPEISCPNCGQAYTITPEQWPLYQDQDIECTQCRRPFLVTAAGPAPAAPRAGPARTAGSEAPAFQFPPYNQVRRLISRHVWRGSYEHITGGRLLAHWKADPESWEATIASRLRNGQMIANWLLWGMIAVGVIVDIIGVIVNPGVLRHGILGEGLINSLGLLLLPGMTAAMGAIFWLTVHFTYKGKAKLMRERGGDVWITSNGLLQGIECLQWNFVEKMTTRHYTFLGAALFPGELAVEFRVLSTYGPPDQAAKAAVMRVVGGVLFGHGGASTFAKELLYRIIEVPPGKEAEARRVVAELLAQADPEFRSVLQTAAAPPARSRAAPVPARAAKSSSALPIFALGILALAACGIGIAAIVYCQSQSDSGDSPAAPTAFSKGHHRVVFVLDRRGSLLNQLGDAKSQVLIALSRLEPSKSFDIVVGNANGTKLFRDALVPATPQNIEAATRFLDPITTENSSGLADELTAALKLNPQVVWVITTGDNPDSDFARISQANAACRARINTPAHFGIGKSPASLHNLWRMVRDNGGVCIGDDGKPISEPPTQIQPRDLHNPGEIPDGMGLLQE